MTGRVVLVTGASRGVGARTATLLADAGAELVLNYRTHHVLAEKVARAVAAHGPRPLTVRADLTDPEQTAEMFRQVDQVVGRLDAVVLNASGGLEPDRDPGYATRLNVEAQVRVLDLALPRMPIGGRVVYVTSHQAHFHGTDRADSVPEYEPVAASKRAGEDAVRARSAELDRRGVTLRVVSGDVLERTATSLLLERARPDVFRRRREMLGGSLLSVDEFAAAVAAAAIGPAAPHGSTHYVGAVAPTAHRPTSG